MEKRDTCVAHTCHASMSVNDVTGGFAAGQRVKRQGRIHQEATHALATYNCSADGRAEPHRLGVLEFFKDAEGPGGAAHVPAHDIDGAAANAASGAIIISGFAASATATAAALTRQCLLAPSTRLPLVCRVVSPGMLGCQWWLQSLLLLLLLPLPALLPTGAVITMLRIIATSAAAADTPPPGPT